MSGRLAWHGDKCSKAIELHTKRLLQASARMVVNRAKQLLNVSGTSKLAKAKPAKKGEAAKKKGSLVYGTNPSAPGEPPHKQTARLIGSVAMEMVGLTARVGTNLRYGRWLELGTSRMASRPWLRRALSECLSQIKTLFANSKMNS